MIHLKTTFLQRTVITMLLCAAPMMSQNNVRAAPNSLELNAAIDIALDCSLALQKAEAQVQAKLAECWQAGLLPNPILSVEVDSFGGSGHSCGFDNHESSVSITQLLEMGGKRSARQNVAAANACTAIWEREIVRQNLIRDVKDTFINAYAEQEKIRILSVLSQNAESSYQCVIEKAKNGKASAVEQKRSFLAYNSSKIAYNKAITNFRTAKHKLGAILGQVSPCFENLVFPFFSTSAPLPRVVCEELLDNNPEISQWRMKVSAAAQIYEFERLNRIPDLEITAGVYRENCSNDHSFFVGFDIALPIFDRNQGNICRASWDTWQYHYDQQNLETQLLAQLASVHDQFVRSYEELVRLQNEAVPASKEILNVYEEGYQQGKFECLEVLSAQGGVFEVQMQLIEALTEYHHLKSELERLAPLDSLEDIEDNNA